MSSNLNDKNIDFLFDAILEIKDKEECYKFFEDLCTINERHYFKS